MQYSCELVGLGMRLLSGAMEWEPSIGMNPGETLVMVSVSVSGMGLLGRTRTQGSMVYVLKFFCRFSGVV